VTLFKNTNSGTPLDEKPQEQGRGLVKIGQVRFGENKKDRRNKNRAPGVYGLKQGSQLGEVSLQRQPTGVTGKTFEQKSLGGEGIEVMKT